MKIVFNHLSTFNFTSDKARLIQSWLPFFLSFLPAIALFSFIKTYGVNVGYIDDWVQVDLIQKVKDGNIGFIHFFHQHNEHRPFFPKILITVIALLSRWNLMFQMYLSFVLSILAFLIICLIAYRDSQRPKFQLHFTNLCTSILIFSTIQFENWLWGFQVAWLLMLPAVTLGIFILTSKKFSPWYKLGIAAACCIVSSFSEANGLLAWLALIPCLLTIPVNRTKSSSVLGKPRTVLLIWFFMFLTCCLVYFNGYKKPPGTPDPFLFLKQPLYAVHFFLTMLGTPLTGYYKLSYVLGLVILVLWLFFLCYYSRAYLCKLQPEFLSKATPWISLGLFGFLSTLVTALGRMGWGLDPAFSSRFTTITALLIVAVIHLIYLMAGPQLNRSLPALLAIGMFGLFAWTASVSEQNIEIVELRQRKLLYSQACMELVEQIGSGLDSCIAEIYSLDTNKARNWQIYLDKIGFRHNIKSLGYAESSSYIQGNLEFPKLAAEPQTIRSDCLNCSDKIRLTGWAVNRKKRRPAELILISYGTQDTNTFLGTAQVLQRRPDVAEAFKSQRYIRSGWSFEMPISTLPFREALLRAWVYDSKGKQLVKLGEIPVRVEKS